MAADCCLYNDIATAIRVRESHRSRSARALQSQYIIENQPSDSIQSHNDEYNNNNISDNNNNENEPLSSKDWVSI
jgi:hypothetical protein